MGQLLFSKKFDQVFILKEFCAPIKKENKYFNHTWIKL